MHFQIYKDQLKFWRWRLVAGNNEIIASGEAYYNKQDCLHVIGLIQTSQNAKVYEI